MAKINSWLEKRKAPAFTIRPPSAPEPAVTFVANGAELRFILVPRPLSKAQTDIIHAIAAGEFRNDAVLAARWKHWAVFTSASISAFHRSEEIPKPPPGVTLHFATS